MTEENRILLITEVIEQKLSYEERDSSEPKFDLLFSSIMRTKYGFSKKEYNYLKDNVFSVFEDKDDLLSYERRTKTSKGRYIGKTEITASVCGNYSDFMEILPVMGWLW